MRSEVWDVRHIVAHPKSRFFLVLFILFRGLRVLGLTDFCVPQAKLVPVETTGRGLDCIPISSLKS